MAAAVRFVIALALLAILSGADAATPPVLSQPAELDAEFARVLSDAGIPGGAFALVHGNRVAHVGTYGVRAHGRPERVTAETVFRVASVSKTFAAQLTAMLVGEGVLDWEDGVIDHLPEFRLAHPQHTHELRIHHLLAQSTGIVPNAYDNLLNAGQSLDQIVPRFAELEPMCAPGGCYTYQNVLFALIGPAIERSSGFSYDELIQGRLLDPLGMRHASVGIEGYRVADNRAVPHVRRAGVWWPTEVNENYYRVAPAAGINASVMDLGQWLVAQLGHRPDVIGPELVDAVTAKQVRTSRELRRKAWRDLLTDAHYGLGWRIYALGEDEIVLHSGWVRGFVAEVAYSRDRQLGLAVLLNAESSALNEFTTGFWRRALSDAWLPLQAAIESDESDAGQEAGAAAGGLGISTAP